MKDHLPRLSAIPEQVCNFCVKQEVLQVSLHFGRDIFLSKVPSNCLSRDDSETSKLLEIRLRKFDPQLRSEVPFHGENPIPQHQPEA